MPFLLDTNILLRSAEPAHPMHAEAVDSVSRLLAAGERVCVLPQNISEFWNVFTRPADRNGLGFSVAQADAEVTRIETLITVLLDVPGIYPQWRRMVVQHTVSGVQVHDARIAAAMIAHGIDSIVTFNDGDFRRYAGINVLTPADVINQYPLPT